MKVEVLLRAKLGANLWQAHGVGFGDLELSENSRRKALDLTRHGQTARNGGVRWGS